MHLRIKIVVFFREGKRGWLNYIPTSLLNLFRNSPGVFNYLEISRCSRISKLLKLGRKPQGHKVKRLHYVYLIWHSAQVNERYTINVINSGGPRRFSIVQSSIDQLYHLKLLMFHIKSALLLTLLCGIICHL